MDALPTTQIKVQSTECMDAGVQLNPVAYPTELQKLSVCPTELNTDLMINPNYLPAGNGWSTNAYKAKNDNRVGPLLTMQPDYFLYGNFPVEMATTFYPMTRQIEGWKL